MPPRHRAFQKALRFLLASSALTLLLMAALQFLPALRTKLGVFPSGLARQQEQDRNSVESEIDPADGITPPELSGSAAAGEVPDQTHFPEQPSALQSSTIEVEAPDPFADEAESQPDVPLPPTSAESSGIPSSLERRISELESRQAEREQSLDSPILDLLKSHTADMKTILERIESTERQVLEIKESQSATEAHREPPKIRLESVIVDGEQRLVIEAREGDLPDLLARVGEAAGLNLLVSPDVTGTASLHLSVPDAQKALADVCRIHHCRLKQDGLLTVVSREASGEHTAAKPVLPEHVTKLYRLKHLSGSEIRPYVAAVLTPGLGTVSFASIRERIGRTVYRDPPRAILVKDTPDVIAEVDRLILELDQPHQQGLELPKPAADPFSPMAAAPARPQPLPAVSTRPQPLPAGPALGPLLPAASSCAAPGVESEVFLPPLER